MRPPLTALRAATLCALSAQAFYIPGWSIRSYAPGESIPLLVNKVFSDNTQLQFPYADLRFVCTHDQSALLESKPPQSSDNSDAQSTVASMKGRLASLLGGKSIPLSLGEVLRGDRIVVSDIQISMDHNAPCTMLCNAPVQASDVMRAWELIGRGYVAEWIVDNLPSATKFVSVDKTNNYYSAGFPLGYVDYSAPNGQPKYFVNNHFTIVLLVRNAPGKATDDGAKVIVGFELYPKSVAAGEKRDKNGCPSDLEKTKRGFELTLPEVTAGGPDGNPADLMIPYSYSVQFKEDDTIKWSHRWDRYFVSQGDGARTHWLAILNSLVVCAVLSGVVALILAQTLRADIKSYREMPEVKALRSKRETARARGEGVLGGEADAMLDADDFEDMLDGVTGWKRLHADVFRPPAHGATLLAPLVGSGVQLLFMSVSLLALGAIGVINPSWRGGFISAGVGLFIFAGLFSGYYSARIFRTFGGEGTGGCRANAFFTAALFPGMLFVIGFILNLFVWAQASSTAVPFTTLLAIFFLWLGVQVPLVFIGSWYGHSRAGAYKYSARTSPVARQVPPRPWYLSTVNSMLMAGAMPFLVILIELLYVLQSLWRDKSGYYYVPGFLGIVSAMFLVTVAEVTIVAVYVQLCAEDHRWWWRSFLVGGASAVWVFAYCVWYYIFRLEVQGWVSGLLFFGYSVMACLVHGLLTGTVGFLVAYAFVRRIYTAIKVD